jgi:hypothetical protein
MQYGATRRLLESTARMLGTTVTDLLPERTASDPLPTLRDQARRLLDVLICEGIAEDFLKLNTILALVQEAAARRG